MTPETEGQDVRGTDGPLTSPAMGHGDLAARRVQDDHPSRGPHKECLVDHGGRGVPRHCVRGCKWPCPDESVPPHQQRGRR